MSAIIMDGKKLSEEKRTALRRDVEVLKKSGIQVGLTVIIVGDDPASKVYVRNKERACAEVGIHSSVLRLPEATSQEELEARIREISADTKVHGLLVQLPLPDHLEEEKIRIPYQKDVDGFSVESAGRLLLGRKGFLSCTPAGCMELLNKYDIPIKGKQAVIVGRSNIVGKPMALMLLKEHATVTIAHSRTENLAELTRSADILVAAIGRPKTITADMVKPGATVIDVGINRLENGKLCGDVDFDAVMPIARAITPVPGGVGPMTITMLMHNTVLSASGYYA